MKKQLLFLIIFCWINVLNFAQKDHFNNFTTLKSAGKIPQEFLILSTDKYQKDVDQNKDKNLDKDFFLFTRFVIDELLLSGEVLFNEILSNYVNKVAKYVLRREKNLYKSLQFYVIKSNSVNAFSTDQGIIFITTGLLAQLDNEAQLAFVIGHEVAHYTKKHVRNSYVDKQVITQGKGKYKDLSHNDKLQELSNYSKDNELEADEIGVNFYLNTEYDIEEIYEALGVLLYSYLPFDDIKFDTSYFNTEILNIPGQVFTDTINPITKEEDFDDELSSHPNIKKRMDAIFDVLNDKQSRGDKLFKISEQDFYTVRELARFESINIYLANRKYVKALYNTFLLQKTHPNNKYLNFSKAKALYGLAKYKNHHRYNEVTLNPKKTEGEIYTLAVFIKELSKKQINVIAYRHIYDLSQKYPSDQLIKKYERDMLKELALHSTIKTEELIATNFKTYNDSIQSLLKDINVEDSIAKIEASDLSKYKKIKLKKELQNLQKEGTSPLSNKDYYKTGLSDLVTKGKLKTEIEYFIAQQEIKEQQLKYKKEKPLGIKKIVVVDPYLADYGLKDNVKKVKSEKQKIAVNQIYSKNHNKLDLDIKIVDSKTLTANDVEKYNEIGILYNWVKEILEHDEIKMITSVNDKVNPIKEKYNTEHFLFSGLIKYKTRNEFTMMHLYGILFFYTAPIAIADLLIAHNYFEMFAISINADTDKVEFTQIEDVNIKARTLVMQAYIYNVLYNLNRTK